MAGNFFIVAAGISLLLISAGLAIKLAAEGVRYIDVR